MFGEFWYAASPILLSLPPAFGALFSYIQSRLGVVEEGQDAVFRPEEMEKEEEEEEEEKRNGVFGLGSGKAACKG